MQKVALKSTLEKFKLQALNSEESKKIKGGGDDDGGEGIVMEDIVLG